jgi:hypothetical protein
MRKRILSERKGQKWREGEGGWGEREREGERKREREGDRQRDKHRHRERDRERARESARGTITNWRHEPLELGGLAHRHIHIHELEARTATNWEVLHSWARKTMPKLPVPRTCPRIHERYWSSISSLAAYGLGLRVES